MKVQEKLNSNNELAGYLIDDIEYVPAVGNNERYIEISSIIESGAKVLEDNSMELNKEIQRIQEIKSKANELILARYSIIWQLNHPRVDVQYKSDYDFIDNIRRISNEAEANGTALEDINWEASND